jgi:hypothetical protein
MNDEIGERGEKRLSLTECIKRKQSKKQAHENPEDARTPQQKPARYCRHDYPLESQYGRLRVSCRERAVRKL